MAVFRSYLSSLYSIYNTIHRKKRFTSFPSPAGMSLTKLPLGRNNSVMTLLFPPRESLVVTSRLGTGNSRTFFLRCISPVRDCLSIWLETGEVSWDPKSGPLGIQSSLVGSLSVKGSYSTCVSWGRGRWCRLRRNIVSLLYIYTLSTSDPESIEWSMEDQAFLRSYDSAPRPPLFLHIPPATCLSLSLSVNRLLSFLMEGGWLGTDSYDRENAWASTNHSIPSAPIPLAAFFLPSYHTVLCWRKFFCMSWMWDKPVSISLGNWQKLKKVYSYFSKVEN